MISGAVPDNYRVYLAGRVRPASGWCGRSHRGPDSWRHPVPCISGYSAASEARQPLGPPLGAVLGFVLGQSFTHALFLRDSESVGIDDANQPTCHKHDHSNIFYKTARPARRI